MSQKRPPFGTKSVTSLPSVRSNDDDDDEASDELIELPKSQTSIGSIKSIGSSGSKKDRKFKRKGHSVQKTKSVRKASDLAESEEARKEAKKESEKVADQAGSKKDFAKEVQYSKQQKCLQTPALITFKRSAEPPPTVEETSTLDRFTPSEINLYLENEKDLTETAISKKQQSSVLENLKMPVLKMNTSRTKEGDDQSSEVSTNELENLIFTDIDRLPANFRSPRASIDTESLSGRREDSKISEELTARLENLIMDPAIFERAAETQQVPQTASVTIEDTSTTTTVTNQLTITQATAFTPTPAVPVMPTPSSTLPIIPPVEPVPKETKFDNAIVLFSYKKARKARKKKKKKKRAELRIGLIGAGKMTESIVNTLVNSLKFNPALIFVASPSGRNLELFKSKGCQTTKRNIDLFTRYFCHMIFINVFGGVIRYCYKLGGLKPFPLTISFVPVNRHRYYIFSLVSGVSLEEIRDVIFNSDQIEKYHFEMHRILLNVSCLTKTSICGINCEISQLPPVIKMFLEKFGELEYVPDKEMDAACAIAGSGLAFSYYFLNAISDGSVKIGMSKEKSIRLVSQIANSSVECFNRTQDAESFSQFFNEGHPALVGLDCLKKLNVAAGIENAIKAAYNRIIELASIEIAPQFSSD